ncbi:MAG: hypothetical protein ACXIUW_11290 [Roseinatronobacter sp.]
MTTTVTFEFVGYLPQDIFLEFIGHRAAYLSIGYAMQTQSDHRAVVQVWGPPSMVDAFEMAVSLGPAACLIHDVRRMGNELERPE